MAYSDILRGTSCDTNDVADLIDGTLIRYAQFNSNTLVNTSSTTLVNVAGSDCTVSVGTGERALLVAAMNVSAGTAPAVVTFGVSANGADLAFGNNVTLPTGMTSGVNVVIPWVMVYEGLPGTTTFRLRWSVDTGTAYSQYQRLVVLVFQNY